MRPPLYDLTREEQAELAALIVVTMDMEDAATTEAYREIKNRERDVP